MGVCVVCDFSVSGGGNRHKKGHCPTGKPNSKNRSPRSAAGDPFNELGVKRGMPVADTGKPEGEKKFGSPTRAV